MQLSDLVKPIDQMSDDELKESLKALRHRRTTERPALAKHKAKAEKKEAAPKMTKVKNLLAGLSPDEMAKLLKQLGE